MNVSHLFRAACLATGCAAFAATPPSPTPNYGKLPLVFQPNVGQTDSRVNYFANSRDYTIFFTPQTTTLTLRKDAQTSVALQLSFVNATPVTPTAEAPAPSVTNFYVGKNASQWKSNIPNYSRIRYASLYPSTDAVFYGNGEKLEYDLELAAHADPSRIRLAIKGADHLAVNKSGDLVISASQKDVVFHRPLSYQVIGGTRHAIASAFRIHGDGTVGFTLGAYDRSQALVIDPTLLYSTFIGGTNDDYSRAIAIDGSGNAYITGETLSTDYPTTPGAFNNGSTAFYKLIVSKINPSGSALVYSTEFGGQNGGDDEGTGIAVDSAGSAYISATVNPNQFPTTSGVVEPTSQNQYFSAAAIKLNPQGGLVWSTFVGSAALTEANAIALDSSNNVYVTGNAAPGMPTSAGAFQATGPQNMQSPVVAKVNPSGTALLYGTYLAGSDFGSFAGGIKVDPSGNAYVTGSTQATNFPVTSNAYQKTLQLGRNPVGSAQNAFVSVLNSGGTSLLYSTYFGSEYITSYAVGLDNQNNFFITGDAGPNNIPTTSGAYQTANKGGSDAWVAKFSAVTNGGGGGGGCLPSGPGAKICQPTNGSTVVNPFTLQAGATAASGNITAIRVYDNNNSILTVNNPGQTQS